MGINIRKLRADEIECRIGVIRENGLSLLLYMDARAAQNILDETFGSYGWQRRHDEIGGNLYCTVSVYDTETDKWIAKQDVGVMAKAEKEKSQASDSFKRACVNWGIGRELYSAPFIWIEASKAKIQRADSGTLISRERFFVKQIEYDPEGRINNLVIENQQNAVVFNYESGELSAKTTEKKGLTKTQMSVLNKQLKRTGVEIERVLERYGISSIDEMTKEIYQIAISDLEITKPKAA